jgi:hypothetical protein
LRVTPRILWIILFIASGACLLQLQTRYFRGWHSAFNIQGPGGSVGYFLGRTFLLTAMGKVGSFRSSYRCIRDQFDSDDGIASDSSR